MEQTGDITIMKQEWKKYRKETRSGNNRPTNRKQKRQHEWQNEEAPKNK